MISMCPTCYQEIPAVILVGEQGVVMQKNCPEHGEFFGLVERDPAFYTYWKNNNGAIYPGHLVDVTTRCNLRCKYCYFEKGDQDVPLTDILAECRKAPGPYILTGGEPTLRPDLPGVIQAVSEVGPAYFLTNGTGLLDREYMRACNEQVFRYNGFSGIGLSYHAEFDGFDQVIENLYLENIKPTTCFFVIDNLDQLPEIKRFAEQHRGFFEMIRIKCASAIWSEQKTAQIFVSDVVKWFAEQGLISFPPTGKSVYLPFSQNGVLYAAISWFDINNVDLSEIDCPPTYTAKTGETMDFVKAMLVNEGLQRGTLRYAV